jgi:hypothetical protein
MKLRIHSDSIRLRLSQADVLRFKDEGSVASAINFGPGERLFYRLSMDGRIDGPAATFKAGEIDVRLPMEMAVNWTRSDEVGISGNQNLNSDITLQILIEKDFGCLNERPRGEDADTYRHPLADRLF